LINSLDPYRSTVFLPSNLCSSYSLPKQSFGNSTWPIEKKDIFWGIIILEFIDFCLKLINIY
jgi:hypothetical protein